MIYANRYEWPDEDVAGIMASMWAPWPGWAVPPSDWSLLGEFDGANRTLILTPPLDKPAMYVRTAAPPR